MTAELTKSVHVRARTVGKWETPAMATRSRLALRSIVALTATIVMVAAWAPVVSAEVVVPGPAAGTQANPPTSTVEIINTGAGQGVNGFMSPLTPAERLAGYPEEPDPSWPTNNVGFAGLIQDAGDVRPGNGEPHSSRIASTSSRRRASGATTSAASGPRRASRTSATSHSSCSRTTRRRAEPSSQTNVNARAAAVQSAIWYFSDGYVLATNSPLFATVSGIVARCHSERPLNAPPAPTLTVTGPSNGLKNTIVGPFVVDTNGKEADRDGARGRDGLRGRCGKRCRSARRSRSSTATRSGCVPPGRHQESGTHHQSYRDPARGGRLRVCAATVEPERSCADDHPGRPIDGGNRREHACRVPRHRVVHGHEVDHR